MTAKHRTLKEPLAHVKHALVRNKRRMAKWKTYTQYATTLSEYAFVCLYAYMYIAWYKNRYA